MTIILERVYDAAPQVSGYRVLVDRLDGDRPLLLLDIGIDLRRNPKQTKCRFFP